MDDTSRLAATIDEMFHNSSAETRAETEKEFMVQMVARFGPIASMVQWIGLSAVLAIALAVLNAASMTVRERTREIAVPKILGFSSGQILLETSVEKGIGGAAGRNDWRRCIGKIRRDYEICTTPTVSNTITSRVKHNSKLEGEWN